MLGSGFVASRAVVMPGVRVETGGRLSALSLAVKEEIVKSRGRNGLITYYLLVMCLVSCQNFVYSVTLHCMAGLVNKSPSFYFIQ